MILGISPINWSLERVRQRKHNYTACKLTACATGKRSTRNTIKGIISNTKYRAAIPRMRLREKNLPDHGGSSNRNETCNKLKSWSETFSLHT